MNQCAAIIFIVCNFIYKEHMHSSIPVVNGRNTNPYQKTSLQNGKHKQKTLGELASTDCFYLTK